MIRGEGCIQNSVPLAGHEEPALNQPSHLLPSDHIIDVMYKHIGLLIRKDGMAHEEFTDYWKGTHADIAKDIEGVLRYQQIHPTDPKTAPCDGLAELYFETFEDLTAALGVESERDFHPDLENAAHARQDANNFLKIRKRPKIVGREVVEFDEAEWNTDGLVKLSTFLTRDASLSHKVFLKRWETDYVPLLQEVPGVVRHARVLPNDPNIAEFDGVSELYFEDINILNDVVEGRTTGSSRDETRGKTEGIPSIDQILPVESSRNFVGIDHVQTDKR